MLEKRQRQEASCARVLYQPSDHWLFRYLGLEKGENKPSVSLAMFRRQQGTEKLKRPWIDIGMDLMAENEIHKGNRNAWLTV